MRQTQTRKNVNAVVGQRQLVGVAHRQDQIRTGFLRLIGAHAQHASRDVNPDHPVGISTLS